MTNQGKVPLKNPGKTTDDVTLLAMTSSILNLKFDENVLRRDLDFR